MTRNIIFFPLALAALSLVGSTSLAGGKTKTSQKAKRKVSNQGAMHVSQTEIQEIMKSYSPQEPKYFKVIEKIDDSFYYIELVNSRTQVCEGKKVNVTESGIVFKKRTWPCRQGEHK